MTDNEKIKFLRRMACSPMVSNGMANLLEDVATRLENANAEIERLKTEKDNLIRTYAECQAEAVKEFAEILKGDAVGWLEITVDDVDEAARKVLNKND